MSKPKHSTEEKIRYYEKQLNDINNKIRQIKKGLNEFKKNLKNEYKNFQKILVIGILTIIFSLVGIIYFQTIEYKSLLFSNNFWNAMFGIGIAISTVSFIYYQIYRTKYDDIRIMIAKHQVDYLVHLRLEKNRIETIYSLTLTLHMSDIIKPEKLIKYSLAGAIASKNDSVLPEAFIKYLKDELKKNKKLNKKQIKRIKAAIKGFEYARDERDIMGEWTKK
jgi:preprotein translocase subunit Sss1